MSDGGVGSAGMGTAEASSEQESARWCDGKGKHKIPPTYARAEECARPLYGRRDDDGLDGPAG
jgi:hypothetical protein